MNHIIVNSSEACTHKAMRKSTKYLVYVQTRTFWDGPHSVEASVTVMNELVSTVDLALYNDSMWFGVRSLYGH